jgi:ABC-type arginine transport system permease subunit
LFFLCAAALYFAVTLISQVFFNVIERLVRLNVGAK